MCRRWLIFLAIFSISVTTLGQTTYTWQGANGSWATSTNWNPTRTTPANNDILVFNNVTCSPTNVPSQTIGKLQLINNANVTLMPSNGGNRILSVNSTATDALVVPSNCFLTISGETSNNRNLTITLSSTGTASISGTLRVLLNGGAGSITNGAGTINFNTGSIYEHARDAGSIPTATWSTGSTCYISGVRNTIPTGASFGQSFYNLTYDCPGQTGTETFAGNLTTVNGNFTITSTGVNNLRLAGNQSPTLTVGGNFTLDGGIFDMSSGTGTPVMYVAGDFTLTSGTTLTESGSGNNSSIVFNKSGTQTLTNGGATISRVLNFTVNSGSILDVGTSIIDGSTGTFTLNSGAGLITQHVEGISTTAGTGCIQVTGTKTYNAGADYTYNSSSANQVTGNGLPSIVHNLTIGNTAANGIVTLTNSITINGSLTLNSGVLFLGNNNITLANGANLAGNSPGAANMVATGTGRFFKYFTTGTPSFTFPIGDITSTVEYSPVSLGFTANSAAGTVGVSVTNTTHPFINTGGTATAYLSRYWTFTTTGLTNYTYNVSTYQYYASDINGTEALMKLGYWNGTSWTSIANSNASGNSLSISSSLTQATGPLNGIAYTGRYVMPSYYSSGNTDASSVNNWWSNINGTGSHPANFTSNNQRFVIQNGHSMTTGSGWTVSGTNTILEIQNGGTLTETNAISISANTTLNVNNGGTLNHNVNSLSVFGGTESFGNTSNIDYGFAGTQSVVVADYGNLSISGSGTKTLQGNITLTGNLTISGSTLDLGTYTADRTIAGGTFNLGATSILLIGGTNTFPANYTTNTLSAGSIVTYTGTTQTVGALTYSGLTISGSATKTLGGSTTVNGTLTLTSGTFAVAANALTLNGPAIVGTPNNLSTTAASTLVFGGSSAGIIVPSGVSSLNNLTVSNANGISLSGPLSTGTLTFSSGILNTTAINLLTIKNTNAGSIGGASATSYINGPLARTLLANQLNYGSPYLYPVGDGANYRPLELVNITTGAIAPVVLVFENGTGAMNGDESTITSISPRNWYLQNISGNFTSAFIRLTESGLDFSKTIGQSVGQSGNYVSVGGTNIGTSITSASAIASTALPAYFAIGTTVIKTFYSYQSGDWNSVNTWTIDPSGSLWINSAIPISGDNVVILNGRTVTINQNGKNSLTLEIRLGGILDLQAYNTHNFGTVSGQGTLKLSSGTFPGGIYTDFVDPNGGTVEYYNLNATGISSTQRTYNNLIISNYNSTANSVFLNNVANPTNYSLNGTFDLKNNSSGSLTFYFGNSTASDNLINMTVNGNFTIGAGCNIRVNNFATSHAIPNANNNTTPYPVHSLSLYGDFLNNGSARFTGLPSPLINAYYTLANTSYGGTNYGDVQVYFRGATNNTLTCNGITDFFRFVVEKGSDQTNTLEVVSSNTSNFALYAPNNQGNNTFDGVPEGYGTGAYYKALFIHFGTLKLGANITIPSLSEGGQDFNLIPTAGLWINGANVSTTVTAVNGTGYQAATLYGRLRISSGQFSTGDAAGIVLGILGTPEIQIEGTGILDASQTWSASGGTNRVSYIQTGGTANFRLQGENHAGPMLGLANTSTVFNMSGGTLNFTDNTFIGGGTDFQIMDIQPQTGNYQVTGGIINLNLPSSGTVYTINSTAPFYNLNITNKTGSGTTTIRWVSPASNVTVLNDLSLSTGTALDLGTNSIDMIVGHNFSLPAGATYTPGNNTTTFNGNGGQVFTNAGTITTGLNNFVLSNKSNINITNNLTIRGVLIINSSCFLNDQGNSISVAGNITNSGAHTSQANGSIILNGAGAQIIDGTGTGAFGNFTVNKTAGTSTFAANQSVNGNLRLVSGILNIDKYNLALSASSNIYDVLAGTPAPTTFGNTKMITTSGQQSDGGLTKTFNTTGSFLYPVGAGAVYHPGTIAFSQAPATWGDVTVRPVARAHPFALAGNEVLTYYWKVSSNFITGIQAGSVSHSYKYVAADAGAAINTYITGVYNPYSWIPGAVAQVDKINRNVLFPSVNILDGEYTAGIPAAFGVVRVYYSHHSGDWDTQSTWSNISNNPASPDATTFPGPDDPVVIGDGGSNNHVVTISANTKSVGGLQISTGSILDIKSTTGHNFGALPDLKVTGTGTLRISSNGPTAAFPSGDFGNFLGQNGGTIEYYTETAPSNIGAAFTLPTTFVTGSTTINISNYYNLILSPATGKNITLPNTDLIIYKDFNINVSGTSATGIARLNSQNTTRTLTINGNIQINKGNLQYTNGGSTAQNVVVNGDVNVANGAIFDVAAALAATNTLTVKGDLTNNGTFDMIAGGTQICNVTFTGVDNKKIQGTTAVRTDFNILTVNKGTDRNPILEATVNAFSLNTALPTALTITNGTFRLSSSLTITLTTSSPFTIPISGCLSANIGTINIGAANNNAADLMLQGRLEVMNAGVVNIGNGGGSDNDIEYSAAGNPEINISGGSLTVDGQIRRNTTNTLGSLSFNQSGGTITLRGNNLNTSRGLFEVVNLGSQFNTSGGNMIIRRAGSVAYADVYIDPQSSDVNGSNGGHTLTIGDGSTPAAQIFDLNTAVPLWNLTIDGTTNNKTVSLLVNKLTLLHNLNINGSSIFKANELDVNISGSLTNNNPSASMGEDQGGYQAGSAGSIQTTTFTGNGQINGTAGNLTNFAHLIIGSASTTPVVTLGSNSNILVNNNLSLISGTLSDAGNTITVLSDIDNSAIHSSPLTPGGGIVLASGNKQIISGSGTGRFGNVTISNATGVSIIDDCHITGQLSLSGGLLYIDDYKLIMDVNSTFSGPFDSKHMIATNGVLSDEGVQKLFSGSTAGFMFPVGSSGKYRPASFILNSTDGGSIKIVPVNLAHPADNAPINDQLNYYWKISTTGFSGLTSSTQIYQYGTSEVTGNESNYHGALYNNFVWSDYGTSVINTTSHTITISRTDLLPGEYTAGEPANFAGVHKLYSLKSGNWNDGTVWAEDFPTNPACGYYPNGGPVFIQQGHVITMNINSAYAYSVNIEGTLDLGVTSFHNLGNIIDTLHRGTGKIMIQSTASGMFLFPGGNYDSFLASQGTTVELYGSTDATLPLKPGNIYKPYQNLILSGTGIKYMSAEDLKITGNLTLSNSTKLNNSLFNNNVYILGNWTDLNTVSSGFVPGTGFVSFEGSVPQTLTVSGVLTENFYDLKMNNAAGLTIAGSGKVQVSDILTLNYGTITTSSTNSLTLTNASTSAVVGGSLTSFVNGPLLKQISNGSYFIFPVGKAGTPSRYGRVYLSNIVNTGIWEAEYYNSPPVYDITKKKLPISHVSNNEYWRINGVAGGSGNVQLRWDASSGYAGSSAATRSKIRIVEWNPAGVPIAQWEYRGKVLNDGGDSNGTVTTDNIINLAPGANLHYLTIGDEGLPTATITSPLAASICNDAITSTTVTVALTGTPPWSLSYKLGSVTTTLNNIATSPVSIILTSASPGITQPITIPTLFNFNITNINDLTGTPGTNDFVTTVVVTVNPVPVNTITGKTSVGTGEVVGYSTPADASTYVWSLPLGGTLTNGNTANPTVTWGATVGSYTLSLTKTGANGCMATNSVVVTTSATPTPVITGNQYVCAGSVGQVYSTPNVAGHDYTWTITPGTAGTITSGANTSSCTISWNGPANGNNVNVKEHVTSSGSPGIFTNASLPVDIGLQPSATTPSYSSPASVCNGNTASITITNSESGVRYQLRLNSDNSNVSTAVNGNGGTITLTTTPITTNTTYNIYAYTLAPFNCSVQLSNPALTFTVNVSNNIIWTGAVSTDWNVAGNWFCGFVPAATFDAQIPNVANKPVLSSGSAGSVNNLTIDTGSSLTITGNSIQIAGTITNNGIFDATDGTLVVNGSAGQSIGTGIFSSNTIKNLTISNPSGVTLLDTLKVTGIVLVSDGNLASNNYLVLLSSASGTALIDGTGTGNVTGNVTMQRYLPSGFGYKYFSSPFQAANVDQFGDDINLLSSSILFYRYDENRISSGWVNYKVTTNVLNPFAGYAVNFGSSAAAKTADITGVVNNGSISATLSNHNYTYTKGFSIMGNPYPSPIDWDAPSGWTKSNIDNAIYFFKASATDQYGGTYISYVNGISTGGASLNIIPSMQGFFVHVSDGSYPVTGTLAMNNSVRATDLTHPFASKRAYSATTSIPLIRLSVRYSDDAVSTDPMVIYFDEKGTPDYDSQIDALKMLNTDLNIPNLSTIGSDGTLLSINAMAPITGDFYTVPLGLKLNRTGTHTVNIKISDIDESLKGYNIFITDVIAGTQQDLLPDNVFSVTLAKGEYNSRFFLNFSNLTTIVPKTEDKNDIFSIYSFQGKIRATILNLQDKSGMLSVYNFSGKELFKEIIYETGYREYDPGLKDGIYFVTYTSGSFRSTKKLFIKNP